MAYELVIAVVGSGPVNLRQSNGVLWQWYWKAQSLFN